LNSGPPPYQGGALTAGATKACVPGAGLEPASLPSKAVRPAVERPRTVSRRSVPSRTSRFTGAGPQPCAAAGVSSVRFERTLASPSDWCLCRWATKTWSQYLVSSRAVRRTKAESQAVRIGMASGAGVEPARADFRGLLGAPTSHPESSTRSGTRTRRRQGLSLPAFPISVIRAYAARDSNSVLRSKSPVHHLSCLRRLRAVPGNRTPMIRLEA
jgi:hypothetical protein